MTSAYGGFDEDRQRMIAETSEFITWGLLHPDKIQWIPARADRRSGCSRRLSLVFWTPIFTEHVRRQASWLRSLLGRR